MDSQSLSYYGTIECQDLPTTWPPFSEPASRKTASLIWIWRLESQVVNIVGLIKESVTWRGYHEPWWERNAGAQKSGSNFFKFWVGLHIIRPLLWWLPVPTLHPPPSPGIGSSRLGCPMLSGHMLVPHLGWIVGPVFVSKIVYRPLDSNSSLCLMREYFLVLVWDVKMLNHWDPKNMFGNTGFFSLKIWILATKVIRVGWLATCEWIYCS